jgi:hypothetical protein
LSNQANTTKAIKDAQVKDGNDILKSFERMKAGKNNVIHLSNNVLYMLEPCYSVSCIVIFSGYLQTSNNCALDAENINLVVPGNGGTAGGVEKLQDIPTEEERKESEEESLAGFHNDMMKVGVYFIFCIIIFQYLIINDKVPFFLGFATRPEAGTTQ